MTGNQASPAQAGLPAPQAATAHPHDPAGHHPIGRQPAELLLAAAAKKTARYAPLLLAGATAAVLAMAATPAMASAVSFAKILDKGDIVTGVRGTTNGDVILTGSQATGTDDDALPFLYQGPLTSAAEDPNFSVLTPPFPGGIKTATFYGPDTNSFNPDTIPQARSAPSEATRP